jgi:hypothetical protein
MLDGNSGTGKQKILLVRAHRTLPLQLPRERAREIRTCNLAKDRGSVPNHRVAADRGESRQILAVFDQREGCGSPRQSTTAQTNQPAPTGSEDRLVEHKGSVRRGVVFSRQGRARSVGYAVAQNRARVGQMFDALSCVKNNTGTAKKFEGSVSGNAFLRPLVLKGLIIMQQRSGAARSARIAVRLSPILFT